METSKSICQVVFSNKDHKGVLTMSNLPSLFTRAEKPNVAKVQAAKE